MVYCIVLCVRSYPTSIIVTPPSYEILRLTAEREICALAKVASDRDCRYRLLPYGIERASPSNVSPSASSNSRMCLIILLYNPKPSIFRLLQIDCNVESLWQQAMDRWKEY